MASWRSEPARLTASWQAYRQVAPKWPPLVHAAGAVRPEQESGRWHRLGEGFAQYFALSPQGAWAELVRYHCIRDAELAREQRRNLWLATIHQRDIADLSTFPHWDDVGLNPAVAVGAHASAQDLAEELRDAGYRGLLAPSAALPEAVNLTLFGPRYELLHRSADGLDPDTWVACERAAMEAWPPLELLTRSCFRGQPHLGLERHLATS